MKSQVPTGLWGTLRGSRGSLHSRTENEHTLSIIFGRCRFLQDSPEQTFKDYDDTKHVIRGVGRVRFLLDCGKLLEVVGVLYIQ